MTVGYGPLLRRDGPYPSGRSNTLLDIAQVVTDDDAHWMNGVALQSYSPSPGWGFDPCGEGSNAIKPAGLPVSTPEFGPVQIGWSETCTARVVGPDPEVWYTQRAIIGLSATEEAQIETTLMTGGAVPGNPHLTDGNLVQLNSGGATDPVEGMALLEEEIGATKKGGVIHAAPATIAYWDYYKLIHEPGKQGLLYTKSGTPVVDGYGYIGAYPDGGSAPSASEDWAFATGPIKIWREPAITLLPEFYFQALDRSTNTVTYRAERTYVITFDSDTTSGANPPLQVGVLIDRSIDP